MALENVGLFQYLMCISEKPNVALKKIEGPLNFLILGAKWPLKFEVYFDPWGPALGLPTSVLEQSLMLCVDQGNLKGESVLAAILPSRYGSELLYLRIFS